MGLCSPSGVMPIPYTELILERAQEKDNGFRDFLDIFNHRLISLMYRTRKVHRVTLSSQSPEQGPMANYLYAFLGLGLSGLRNRMGKEVPDRVLLPYAGLLHQRPRSVVGLEHFLADHFRVFVHVEQFSGVWRNIEPDEQTAIGLSGKNQVLGRSVVVGKRIWDQQGRFLILVGPLPLKEFLDFLPDGTAHKPLCELTRFYAGPEFEFKVQLKIQAAQIPELRLGKSKLGWTTWLKTHPGKRDSQVELSSEYKAQKHNALVMKGHNTDATDFIDQH